MSLLVLVPTMRMIFPRRHISRNFNVLSRRLSFQNIINGMFSTMEQELKSPVSTTTTSSSSAISSPVGLFGLKNIFNVNDFIHQSNLCIQNCNKIRNKIYSLPVTKETSSEILELLDQISNEVCSIIDPAELCRNTHCHEEYREIANNIFHNLSILINELNADQRIYNKMKDIYNNQEIYHQLTPEEAIFCLDMIQEYENEGIQITNMEKRQMIMNLQNKLVTIESNFLENISEMESKINQTSGSSTYPIGPLPDHEYQILHRWLTSQGIPQQLLPFHSKKYLQSDPSSATSSSTSSSSSPTPTPPTTSNNYVMLPFNKSIGQSLLRFISSSELRKRIYSIISSQPETNLPLLSQLILFRQKLSQLMGFHSYGERILSRKVLKNPSDVLTLLNQLTNATRKQVMNEIKILEKMKEMMSMSHGPTSTSSPSASLPDIKVYPWDISYLGDVYTQTQRKQNLSNLSHDQAVREFQQYCSLETCLTGLEYICDSLFGITMKREILNENEIWTENPQDIIKYTLSHMDDTSSNTVSIPLGTIYIDPYTRDYKFSGASHFTIRCGCSNMRIPDSSMKYQLPIVALVFSFPKDPHGGPLHLTPHQLENLYHEWGHALHSLLSRTKFQHLSGTRGSAEFAEVPSHLFEYFSRDPHVIVKWAKHSITGNSPSLSLVQEALSQHKYFSAIEMQTQILYAAIDQKMYSSEILDGINLSEYPSSDTRKNNEIEYQVMEKISQSLSETQQQYTGLPIGYIDRNSPYAPITIDQILKLQLLKNKSQSIFLGNAHLLTHSHTITYGATYYSYLFARLHASQIWNVHFKKNPLSRVSGMILWQRLLRYGGSKSPSEILEDVGGGPLDPSHLMNELQ